MSICRHCYQHLRLCRCGIGGDEGHWVTAVGPLADVTHCGPYPDGERWRRHEPEQPARALREET